MTDLQYELTMLMLEEISNIYKSIGNAGELMNQLASSKPLLTSKESQTLLGFAKKIFDSIDIIKSLEDDLITLTKIANLN